MPPDLIHPTLGPLTFDPRLDGYSAQVSVEGRDVGIHLFPGGRDGNGPGLKAAAGLALGLAALVRDAKQYAATMLLSIKNEAWLDADEPELTLEAFVERMQIESVGVNEDGSADLYFEDGDLFWGHVIVVARGTHGAFEEASIGG